MQHRTLPSSLKRRRGGRASQRGITLVEWMVSITIGLVLLSGLLLLFAQQSNTQNELQKSSRQIENGRYAMQLLRDDIQLAGYYGEFFNVASLTVPTVLPNPCVTAVADLAAALPFPVQGYNGPGATLPADFAACPLVAANHIPGTDILVIRRTDVSVLAGAPDNGRVYMQTGLTASKQALSYVLGVAGTTVDTALFNLKKKDDSTAPLRKYYVHIYYLSPCSVPANGSTCSANKTDDGGISVPTLKRLELSVSGGAAAFSNVPLVEGIENMQFTYGFDSSAGAGSDSDDGVPDSEGEDDSPDVASWANLMSIRVYLLARNNEPSAGYTDRKTYKLGAVTTTATNDAFKRRVFSQTVRVVNPSARRDK